MITSMDLELAKAAHIIIFDLLKVKKDESVLITVDSAMDIRPAEECAKMAQAAGAKVMLAWHTTPKGYGKVGQPYLPDALKACIPHTDVWIEFNDQWLLYSDAWEEAINNGRTRYLCYGGLDTACVCRCIGALNMEAQIPFQNTLVEMTQKARKVRMTNPAGTDVTFENSPDRPVTNELLADTPGPHFLLGNIAWAPIEETMNGVIVFDGTFSGGGDADIGRLETPITFKIEKGRIVEISGGQEAEIVKKWFADLDDDRMYNVAHATYGVNPGAKLEGICCEDERFWGCTEWGFGQQGSYFKGGFGDAKSHCDGTCLNSSVWLDDVQILDEGVFVEPTLAALAKACGK
jgi:2,5-dihydroxypyridine 5,6-dioxygenase